jgi:hypothetical protein
VTAGKIPPEGSAPKVESTWRVTDPLPPSAALPLFKAVLSKLDSDNVSRSRNHWLF